MYKLKKWGPTSQANSQIDINKHKNLVNDFVTPHQFLKIYYFIGRKFRGYKPWRV